MNHFNYNGKSFLALRKNDCDLQGRIFKKLTNKLCKREREAFALLAIKILSKSKYNQVNMVWIKEQTNGSVEEWICNFIEF